jgi:hypothetical protein
MKKQIFALGCKYEVERVYGSFSIHVQYTHSNIDVDPLNLCDLSICVEEAFQGRNLSRALIRDLLSSLDPNFVDHATAYIDTDASAGFWDYAGLKPNPDYDTPDVPQRGYEKYIQLKDLKAFAHELRRVR